MHGLIFYFDFYFSGISCPDRSMVSWSCGTRGPETRPKLFRCDRHGLCAPFSLRRAITLVSYRSRRYYGLFIFYIWRNWMHDVLQPAVEWTICAPFTMSTIETVRERPRLHASWPVMKVSSPPVASWKVHANSLVSKLQSKLSFW